MFNAYDNAAEFVKDAKRQSDISIIESVLWQMKYGEVENLKSNYGCRDADIRYLATKILERAE